ncbi:Cob(I)yrinic acid a,c-diamide adenosyltransferase, partial [Exaiptasia diaphana]
QGPIAVVYPEGIWYHGVDEQAIRRIFKEHLVEGRPVEELIFDRHNPDMLKPEPDSNEESPSADAGEQDEEAEAYRAKVRKEKKKKGLVIVNTGNGKGKTTAALGILMRSTGRRMRTAVVQFLKPPKARFGEIVAGREMGIDWVGTGDGWTWKSKDLDESEARAQHGWELAQEKIASGDYDVVLLDEFTYPMHYGWIDTQEVLDWIREHKPPMMHLLITGRYAPAELVEFADLVTEMQPIKHPFKEQGIKAQPGIEF